MMLIKSIKIFFFSIFIVICLQTISYAQEQAKQTKSTVQDSTRKNEALKLLLDEIEVKGWIEKPQTVFVVPGVNPEVDDILLDRSFANEIVRPLDKDQFEKQVVKSKKTGIPW